MRVLRWMVLVVGMLGGAFGLGISANAAPMPVASGIVDQASPAPSVQKAYYYFYRRRYWRPRYYYRPRYYRRYYYRPRYHWRRHYRRRWFY